MDERAGRALMTRTPPHVSRTQPRTQPPRAQAASAETSRAIAPGASAEARPWPLFAGLGPLGALPPVPRLARAFTALVLTSWGLGGLADDSKLIASELTSNVIRAATGEDGNPRYDADGRLPVLWLRMLSDRARLRLEVWDNLPPESGVPAERQAADTDEDGRGLAIIRELSQSWGWDPIPAHNAKRVWAVIA
jgi:hypothetical protein